MTVIDFVNGFVAIALMTFAVCCAVLYSQLHTRVVELENWSRVIEEWKTAMGGWKATYATLADKDMEAVGLDPMSSVFACPRCSASAGATEAVPEWKCRACNYAISLPPPGEERLRLLVAERNMIVYNLSTHPYQGEIRYGLDHPVLPPQPPPNREVRDGCPIPRP